MQQEKHSRVAPAVSTRNLSPDQQWESIREKMLSLPTEVLEQFIPFLEALHSGDDEKAERIKSKMLKDAGGEK